MEKRLPLGYRVRPDGRLEARFRINGKQYSVYGFTVNECRQKERKLRDEINQGLYVENRNVTMEQYFEEYIKAKTGSVKEATLIHNRCTYARIGSEFGKVRIRTIEPRQVNRFREKLAAEVEDEKSRLTTHGVNDTLELLSSIFNAAVNDAVIARNPAAGVKKLKRIEEQVKNTTHRKLSNEELALFFDAAAESFYLHLFELMLASGLRVGEALSLYWTDVCFDSDELRVMRSVTKTGGGRVKVGDSAKTEAGRRTIPMNESIRHALQEQKKLTNAYFGTDVIGLVFPSTTGAVARPSSVDTCMKSLCKVAGIEHFSSHAFRHTFASNMVDAGVAPEVLKNILGHTNIRVTIDTYYHANGDRMREAMGNVFSFREAI